MLHAPSEPSVRARLSPERGRPALSLAAALAAARAETGVDLGRAVARAGFTRGHLLDIVIKLPGARGTQAEDDAAEHVVTSLLGEAAADDWLDQVTLEPAPHGGALAVLQSVPETGQYFPIEELPATVAAAVRGLYAGLPPEPLWASGGEQRWTLLELDVDRSDDYARQADVALCATFLPEMLKCYLSGSPFASRRFSRHGEIFAYLKHESGGGDAREALAARRVLEDALDAALVVERCGRVVGSGMGVVYSYVDFALVSLERALAVIRTIASRVGLPPRSWLLFCDSALSEDWAAVHPAAPLPPGQRP
jgi:hypothetical protein